MNYIHPTAYVAPWVKLGDNIKIGPNCSVGYDGFVFPRVDGIIPVFTEHRGGVILEDGVELQANVCVARAIEEGSNTILHKNVKVDNLVHIAHNCDIGENTLIAAGVIFGGYVKVGVVNFFGLNATIKNSITIGSYNLIGAGALVLKSISHLGIWAGVPARKLRENTRFDRSLVDDREYVRDVLEAGDGS